jgi:thymidylate synthase (FAD)
MKIKLKQITHNAEQFIVADVARISSSRKNKKEDVGKLIKYLIQNKHWSPFEHANASYEITTSKAIAIQLLRHRSFVFQEFSQRYAIATDCETVELRKQCKNNRQSSAELIDNKELENKVDKHLSDSMKLYEELIGKGVAREVARMVLPMATQTTLIMTGNIRSWMHFFHVRDDEHAQKECRLIAQAIKQDLQTHFNYIDF